jgi:hypothetical protein
MKKSKLYHETDKNLKISLVLSMLFGFSFVIVLCTGCVGIIGGPTDCCPTIGAFDSTYDWVCPAFCPGGGLTQIDYTIKFTRSNNEECKPSDLTIMVRNVTDNIDLPSHFFDAGKGVYQGREYILITKDTEFELNATTADCAGSLQKILKVRVVEDGSVLTIVRNGKLTRPSFAFPNIPVKAGPGVKIEKVENVNPFDIFISKDGSSPEIIPVSQNSTSLRDQDAAGYWTIGLTNVNDFLIYNELTNPSLTMNIYLKCTCHSP